jgi:hypothetical protein
MATPWVYAKTWAAWSMSWRSLFGGLPKAEISCGKCGAHSKTPADVAVGGEVFVWCPYCGTANILQGAVQI